MKTWSYELNPEGRYVLMLDSRPIVAMTLWAGLDSGSWLKFIVDACNAAEASAFDRHTGRLLREAMEERNGSTSLRTELEADNQRQMAAAWELEEPHRG